MEKKNVQGRAFENIEATDILLKRDVKIFCKELV